MALVKGVNSYVSLDEAMAYFEDRLDAAAWTDAPEVQQNQALVTATAMLDALHWSGVVVSGLQDLAHPRIGEYFDPRLGFRVSHDGTVPKRVIKATFELAYHLLNNDGLLDNTGGVESLELGSIKLSGISNASKIPGFIQQMVDPLLIRGGTNAVWRAN